MKHDTNGHRGSVSLRKITADTVREICALSVADNQNKFVASNAVSIAEAYFTDSAWFRAVYLENHAVGFAMLDIQPQKSEFFLWRLMIDHRYQRQGIGKSALQLITDFLRNQYPAAHELLTSCVQEPGGPQPFYENFGFHLTGKVYDDEAEMCLSL